MKSAMIGHKRIPSREGGVEIVFEELSKRMDKEGHEVHVYNRRGIHVSGSEYKTATNDIKEHEGIKIKSTFTIDKKGLAALTLSFIATIRAVFDKYDIIYYHAEGPCAMLWIPHLFGIRTVATIHGREDIICYTRNKCLKYGNFAA